MMILASTFLGTIIGATIVLMIKAVCASCAKELDERQDD